MRQAEAERSRLVTGALVVALASLVWSHGLAALLKHVGHGHPARSAMALSVASLAAGGIAGGLLLHRRHLLAALAAGAVGAAALAILKEGAAWVLAVPLSTTLASLAGAAFVRNLPPHVSALWATHRTARWVCLVIAAISILQTARLANHITDPKTRWYLTTHNPFWTAHECLPAYVYGAELSARDETNLYDAEHYPALSADAKPKTEIVGLAAEDPFQYPPPFLLLPRAAIAVTQDYATIRSVWFAIQTSVFFLIAVVLALWLGGNRAAVALALVPAALASFPILISLQYGQVHITAIACGVAAMMAFATERKIVGGGLLASAIVAKLFPGLLVIPLLVRRDWRAIVWTTVWGLGLTLLGLAVLGWAPFEAFFTYHLPRLQSGETFAFAKAWPELSEILMADNQGVAGLVGKLRYLGVPGMSVELGQWLTRGVQFAVVVLAVVGARRLQSVGAGRTQRALYWFALLGLGSLTSPGAFGDYVPLVATWMLTLTIPMMRENRRRMVVFGIIWVFEFFLLGTMPIGGFDSPTALAVLSAIGSVAMFALCLWALWALRDSEP